MKLGLAFKASASEFSEALRIFGEFESVGLAAVCVEFHYAADLLDISSLMCIDWRVGPFLAEWTKKLVR